MGDQTFALVYHNHHTIQRHFIEIEYDILSRMLLLYLADDAYAMHNNAQQPFNPMENEMKIKSGD